ncbi:V-type ATP synthase subunit I domain-containing protein [Wolbachia endosymbiont of Anopheles demeilloni]|uniref:hypothetical protein n=1 Tax=Wolbachia endosymbiont of Anopheles demeilloni TaxID=2748871 RepID=UPI00397C8B0C
MKNKENEINRINEEQQEKLEQSEAKLSALEKKNANLESNPKKIFGEGLKDNHKKQLVEELTEEKEKNNTLAKEIKQLSQEFNALQRKNEDLERKIRQLEPGRSFADELSEVTTEVATSTQTEVEYESRGTSMEQKDQGTQSADKTSSKRISKLGKENKSLARDKLMISEQLKQKTKEIDELKKNLKQLQEENTQLRQKVTKGTGVDASSSTGQKEANTVEVQTEEQVIDLYNKEGKYVRTELSDPNTVPAKTTEKSTPLGL